jgi:type IV secretion system protein VirB9
MQKLMILFSVIALLGCATTQQTLPVPSVPMPADIGWSVASRVNLPPDEPTPLRERPATPYEKVYAYEPGEEVRAHVAVGVPLMILLQPGEIIRNDGHGDRSPLPPGDEQPPWDIKKGSVGTPEAPMISITVTRPGLETGYLVTTNKRLYLIRLRSVGKSRVRVIRWTYDEPLITTEKFPPRLLPDPTVPQAYHVGYVVEASEPRPTWTPPQVVDDGRKTYILFPGNVAAMTAPMIRVMHTTGYEIVNPRMVGSVMVLDHLFTMAELRLGSGPRAETVRVTRQETRAIMCPGDQNCPAWPAQLVAGR